MGPRVRSYLKELPEPEPPLRLLGASLLMCLLSGVWGLLLYLDLLLVLLLLLLLDIVCGSALYMLSASCALCTSERPSLGR